MDYGLSVSRKGWDYKRAMHFVEAFAGVPPGKGFDRADYPKCSTQIADKEDVRKFVRFACVVCVDSMPQDPERYAPTTGPDPLQTQGVRFASLEPMPARRATGDVCELPILGRMVFNRMPDDVQSFWQGIQAVPDSPYTLEIVCDVVDDRLPGAGHEARLVGMRLCLVPETLAALGLINGCRSELHMPRPVGIRELVVTGIHLPARPLLDPWCQRTYRSIALDGNSIAVVFALGVPVSVRIRRN